MNREDNDIWQTALRPRFDLNPERFTHYHPKMGRWFKNHPVLPPCAITLPPDREPPLLPGCRPKPPECGDPPVQAVPEPSSLGMLSIVAVWAWLLVVFTRRRR